MSSAEASTPHSTAVRGAIAATGCYLAWGLVPLYWKQLAGLDPVELIAHRHVWSLALLLVIVVIQGSSRDLIQALRNRSIVRRNLLSATLLTANWLVYVWGVNTGKVIETSLGYFLVPLANVALGRCVLHERLHRLQWVAIGAAALGVTVMVWQLGHPPWIALALAGSWSMYGLIRKRASLGSLLGLTSETLLIAPLALGYLFWRHHLGTGALGTVGLRQHLLVLSSGWITALPLLLFAYGARRLRLSTLGLLQYLAPSVQFSLGVWYYREPFAFERVLGFAFIWFGLVLYTADNLLATRPKRRPETAR